MVKTRTCSMMMHQKMINKKKRKNNSKMLVRVNVVGSTGPVRLVVKEDDSVAAVVKSALRAYANDGRLLSGHLGSYNHNDSFVLYPSNYNGFSDYCQALNPGEAIGRSGRRNFVLCKKQLNHATTTSEGSSDVVNGISQKVSFISLKAWFNRHFARFWLGC